MIENGITYLSLSTKQATYNNIKQLASIAIIDSQSKERLFYAELNDYGFHASADNEDVLIPTSMFAEARTFELIKDSRYMLKDNKRMVLRKLVEWFNGLGAERVKFIIDDPVDWLLFNDLLMHDSFVSSSIRDKMDKKPIHLDSILYLIGETRDKNKIMKMEDLTDFALSISKRNAAIYVLINNLLSKLNFKDIL
jgi:hypothetical protein